MIVYMVGDFAKKKNSTKRPVLTAASVKTFDMQLKEETSVLNPILLLNPSTTGMPVPFTPTYFNYAFIPTFQKYYFVTDWQFVNGLWYCYMSVDVLATYKTGIGTLSEYVVRSSSNYNGYISDVFYPTHSNPTITDTTISLGLNLTGFYIIGIINNLSTASTGAITYYFVSAAQMANIKSYLMSETFLSNNGLANLAEMNKELVKVLYNPYQYIASCKFIPLSFPTVGTDENLNFGWWSIPYQGRRMSDLGYVATAVATFNISQHPQVSRGSFLNHAPYTERYLVHPLLGTIVLDSNKMDATDQIAITITCDVITGEASFTVSDTTKNITLYQSSIILGVDIQLAQMNTDVISMARTAVESTGNVVSAITRLDVAGAITSTATGVLNTLESSIPILQSSGSNGNMSLFNLPVHLIQCYRNLVNEDLSHKGRPLCEIKTINTLSGYIMCSDAHAELACYDTERQEIVNYMNNGFYYE